MKKVFGYVIIFVLGCITSIFVILSFVGPGSIDWDYKLPNDYVLCRINSDRVLINYVGSQQQVEKISTFIKEFSYDERYVFTRNVEHISNNNILDEKYYVLDTLEKKKYGPFNSIEELKKQADNLNVIIPLKWYRTSPDPNFNR